MGLTGQQNDSSTASDFGSVGEAPADKAPVDKAPVDKAPVADKAPTKGGRKHRRSRKKGRKSKKSRKGSKKGSKKGSRKARKTRKRKRGLNPYFKLMLAAKKAGAASFKYKGKTYKGRKHNRLGMIYKKA